MCVLLVLALLSAATSAAAAGSHDGTYVWAPGDCEDPQAPGFARTFMLRVTGVDARLQFAIEDLRGEVNATLHQTRCGGELMETFEWVLTSPAMELADEGEIPALFEVPNPSPGATGRYVSAVSKIALHFEHGVQTRSAAYYGATLPDVGAPLACVPDNASSADVSAHLLEAFAHSPSFKWGNAFGCALSPWWASHASRDRVYVASNATVNAGIAPGCDMVIYVQFIGSSFTRYAKMALPLLEVDGGGFVCDEFHSMTLHQENFADWMTSEGVHEPGPSPTARASVAFFNEFFTGMLAVIQEVAFDQIDALHIPQLHGASLEFVTVLFDAVSAGSARLGALEVLNAVAERVSAGSVNVTAVEFEEVALGVTRAGEVKISEFQLGELAVEGDLGVHRLAMRDVRLGEFDLGAFHLGEATLGGRPARDVLVEEVRPFLDVVVALLAITAVSSLAALSATVWMLVRLGRAGFLASTSARGREFGLRPAL